MIVEDFVKEYSEKRGRQCKDIESMLKDFIEDALEPIRNDLDNIYTDVKSGKFSNDDIADEIEGLRDLI